MKALVILSHLWSHFLTITCLYGEKELLWGSVHPSGVFSRETTPPSNIGVYTEWESFTELFLSNIMKYDKLVYSV